MTDAEFSPEFQQRIAETAEDAALHIAYLRMLHDEDVGELDARAMVVAYIQSKNVAKLTVEMPPEEPERWQG